MFIVRNQINHFNSVGVICILQMLISNSKLNCHDKIITCHSYGVLIVWLLFNYKHSTPYTAIEQPYAEEI